MTKLILDTAVVVVVVSAGVTVVGPETYNLIFESFVFRNIGDCFGRFRLLGFKIVAMVTRPSPQRF